MGASSAQRHEAGKRSKPNNRGTKKGQGALKAGSAFTKSNSSGKQGRTAPNGDKRLKEGGGTHFRSESAIKRIQMYKGKPNMVKMKKQPSGPVRIQPDRRWFGNTRVIAQDKMQAFRETLSKGVDDPFSVVLKSSKLPMSLLRDTEGKSSRMDLLSIEPFKEVFSKGRRQKRVKLGTYDLDDLLSSVDKKADGYSEAKDLQAKVNLSTNVVRDEKVAHEGEAIFKVGTSKRIWNELYKVLDASDVLVFVLDARDPQGTRCRHLERDIKKNRPHKHIIFLLNKVDLVPTWVSRRWVTELTKEYPTIAFHASITNPFGKNALLNLLRQFGNLLKESKHVTIGMLGYPNVGKSSVINTMKRKKVCKSAPVPGETKVWQYITLTKRIYLLDCPGVVPLTQSDFADNSCKVLKGVVRAEKVQCPSAYIDEVLSRVKKQYILSRYKLPADTTWTDANDFLVILGRKMGKLEKGGEPNVDIVAKIVLYDWQRGRIPFFTPPPEDGETPAAASGDKAEADGEDGKEDGDKATPKNPLADAKVEQNLGGLSEVPCVHEYDEEDRRGENRPKEAPAASSADAAPSGEKKRKGAASSSKGEEAGGAPAKRKARRSKGTTNNAKPSMIPQQGSVDWKAVVSEFSM